uniref:Uncharacterized protein n=1 Tax=Chromera velia CCMP2878 TaxID=1169474 RepID=A0A0K6S6E3_9ALVE|eukprot:Cvel_2752.t2-p1 / transcript=Cvel_2752.t2 / gene=Cvel_2752 / organism=Chromera_velia_CCMP2878 / gene_product=Monothiol glutaredoxin-S4, mitochondrial, putative / transcript_product=Monothiol glutaredoxin-S4, mitochondrial, putative / location=Cvel_scaffold110:100148-102059(-) / protein_length=161 / sequence_SO=supercontig / SO=protein_coding / is_pseudo=false
MAGLRRQIFLYSSSDVLNASTAAVYQEVLEGGKKMYEANKPEIDGKMEALLKQNKLVLFMEGQPDHPKSELSMNAVKMLTEAQAVPLVAVDVLAHPALLGYLAAKTKKERAPMVFCDGTFFGDHEDLMSQHSKNTLAGAIGKGPESLSKGAYPGELPIALY